MPPQEDRRDHSRRRVRAAGWNRTGQAVPASQWTAHPRPHPPGLFRNPGSSMKTSWRPGNGRSRVRREIVNANDFSKISMVLPGGPGAAGFGVTNGLDAVGEDCRVVVVHDGVRPFPRLRSFAGLSRKPDGEEPPCRRSPPRTSVKRQTRKGWLWTHWTAGSSGSSRHPRPFPRHSEGGLSKGLRREHYGTERRLPW